MFHRGYTGLIVEQCRTLKVGASTRFDFAKMPECPTPCDATAIANILTIHYGRPRRCEYHVTVNKEIVTVECAAVSPRT